MSQGLDAKTRLGTRRIAALDGVRGIAIAVGFVYHMPASPLPSGAMAVIDMFFVLSGFLIGSIVLKQASGGKLDLAGFWAGRIRRLFPAAGLMLLAWGFAAWWVATPTQWSVWQPQISWAAWYAENFHLISIDNNYFADGRDSPFVHMWSLAVEEQFYLVFPLLVLLAMAIARKTTRFALRQIVGAGALVLGTASWAYAQVIFDPQHPAGAYYDPRAHAHGLLAGVLLACLYRPITQALDARPKADKLVQAAGMLALVVILVATVGADTSTVYHRIGAPLTVVGTLVLVVAAQRPGPASGLLSFKPLAFTGEISYGIYVWAVGITVLLGKPLVESGALPVPAIWLLCAVLTYGIATLSWAFVEMPIRRSAASARHPFTTIGVGVTAMAAIGLIFSVLPARASSEVTATTMVGNNAVTLCGTLDIESQRRHLGCALFVPSPGEPSATILLVGNSTMKSLHPAFTEAAKRNNWRLLSVNVTGCPLARPTPEGSPRSVDMTIGCTEMEPAIDKLIDTGGVDLVVALDMSGAGWYATSESDVTYAVDSYKSALDRWSRRTNVILIEDYRTLDEPGSAPLRTDTADEADSLKYLDRATALDRSRLIVEKSAEGNPAVTIVDVDPTICPSSWPCPETIDDIVVRRDQVHFTERGGTIPMRAIEPAIVEALTR